MGAFSLPQSLPKDNPARNFIVTILLSLDHGSQVQTNRVLGSKTCTLKCWENCFQNFYYRLLLLFQLRRCCAKSTGARVFGKM